MALITPIKLRIAENLEKDKGFRSRFFRGQAQDEIAMSIRELREKRRMRQIDLAKKSNMKQSAISRIEQADYSAWSFTTLFRVADSLDARLRVVLEPIERVIDYYKEKEKVISKEFEQFTSVVLSDAFTESAEEGLSLPSSNSTHINESITPDINAHLSAVM